MRARRGVCFLEAGSDLLGRRNVYKRQRTKYCEVYKPLKGENMSFEKIKGQLGFGCMRLKNENNVVDEKVFCEMIDYYMQNGFNYFDTAHIYLGGESEKALKKCLADRYDREDFILVDKLSYNCFEKQEDIKPFVEKQLSLCGVDYFDFYLMHAQSAGSYKKYKACNAYQTAFELKKQGLVKHVGLSFHDTHDVLDMILTENQEVEVVQIQFNYMDYEDPINESRLCYEVCRKHNKPVLIMEPVKGGRLVNLSQKPREIIDALGNGSYASWAIRFCASFEGVLMVLSGMGSMEMMKDNVSFMKDFVPLTEKEKATLLEVAEILKKENLIPCTNCRYCEDGCPKGIKIPDLFAVYNKMIETNTFNQADYSKVLETSAPAKECAKCGACEQACPQHLEIKKLLNKLYWTYEN